MQCLAEREIATCTGLQNGLQCEQMMVFLSLSLSFSLSSLISRVFVTSLYFPPQRGGE